jgi:hypothetical protein
MNSPIRSLPQAGANGLRPSDISPYKHRSALAKRQARDKAIDVLQRLVLGRTETSILPPHLISELWHNIADNGLKTSKLILWDAFDGGTNFRLEEKSRISSNSPCKLIHDE